MSVGVSALHRREEMKNFPIGNPIKASHERGGILVIAIIVILAMLILAIPFLFKLSGQWRTTEKASHSLAAFNLAEAGVEKVVWEIGLPPTSQYDPIADAERINWSPDETSGTINDIIAANTTLVGQVDFTLDPDPDPGGSAPVTRALRSTGHVLFIASRPVDRRVAVVLEKYFTSVWDYGFFVDDHFQMHNAITLDSYDSGDGSYGGSNINNLGYFGVNSYYDTGSFVVTAGGGGNTIIRGGITAGGDLIGDGNPSTNPDPDLLDQVIDLPKNVEANTLVMDQPFIMDPVDVFDLPPKENWTEDPYNIKNWFEASFTDGTSLPSSTDIKDGFNKGDYSLSGTGTLSEADNGVYTDFSLADGSRLNIDGNVIIYVTGYAESTTSADFFMGRDTQINILDNGSLTLILGKSSFYAGNKFAINAPEGVPGTPADCIILGTEAFTPAAPIPGDISQKDVKKYTGDPDSLPVGYMAFEQGSGNDTGIISAAIYMPGAQVFDLKGMNHIDVYGAWIAYSMFFKVQMQFHYDEALGDLMAVTSGYPKWKVVSWQEVIQ